MRKSFLLLFLFLIPFLGIEVHAQQKLSTDPEKFFQDLMATLKMSQRKEYEKLNKELPTWWVTLQLEQQQLVVRQINAMLAKKMTVFPYFGYYFNAIMPLAKESGEKNFTDFHSVLDSLASKGYKPFEVFCLSAESLQTQSLLYQTNALDWKVDAESFSFSFKEGRPIIEFPKANLVCHYSQDSLYVENCKVQFSPTDNRVMGIGGKTDFHRLGFSADSIYTDLKQFSVLLRQPEIKSDSAVFHLDKLGKKTLSGSYVDQIQAGAKKETATYPRFISYEEKSFIPEIFPNVDYLGKYSIEGAKYICLGTESEPAEIMIRKENAVAVRLRSALFTIKSQDLISDAASATIYLGNDSVYHPGLTTRFNLTKRQLSLFIEKSSLNKSAFSNSYHAIDINCEAVIWNIDSPKLQFRSIVGTGESTATFTSKNFFSMPEFKQIQNIASYHPLARLKGYFQQTKSKTFGTGGFANYMKVSFDAVKVMLLELASQGFIQYDRQNEIVTIQDKTFNYLDASGAKIDYDVLRFVSRTQNEPNAELNISDRKLDIRGVPIALLSDSHQVFIVPRGNKLVMKRNRDMEFEGQVRAGALDFYGDGFNFSYDGFTIKLNNVDSLRFRVYTDEVDKNGRRKTIQLKTVMENINGDLFIDDPKNKSGKRSLKKYPIFDSKKDSYVFFDGPEIQDGVYKRDKFYFLVKPYILDSLDNVSVSKGLEFNGTLFSGGIIPDLKEILKVQPDYSLGFVNQSPAVGYSLYRGKGTFFNTITLDMGGLQGNGKVRYQNTTQISDRHIFMPDSAVAKLSQFTLDKKANPSFPQASGKEVASMWKPQVDSLFLKAGVAEQLRMFEDQTSYFGKLVYTPRTLTGDGNLFYGKEELISKYFIFADNSLEADSAILKLASSDPNLLAFKVEYMKAKIDFTAKKGIFASALEESKVDLPFNQYETYLREFDWDMKNRKLVLGNPKFKGTSYARFKSLNPEQDGFEFSADFAQMDFKDYVLRAEGVKELHSGDAIILPDSGKVNVEKQAKMQRLINAEIFVDSTSRIHRIYKASVDVLGRKKYSAEGIYDYNNLTGKTQNVVFNNIRVDDKGITKASGTVSRDSLLEINPGFKYSGTIQLEGNRQELEFLGVVYLNKMIDEIQVTPFKIKELVDPKKPYIKVSKAEDENGKPLHSGFAYNLTTGFIYPMLFSSYTTPKDTDLISVSGVLKWDPVTGDYSYGDSTKVLEGEPIGSYMRIVSKTKKVEAEGVYNLLPPKALRRCKLAGKLDFALANNGLTVDGVLLMDLDLPEEAAKKMNNSLLDVGFNYEDFSNDRDVVKHAIYNLIGREKAAKVEDDLVSSTAFPTSGELKNAIVFGEIKMEWFPEYKAWQSQDKLGLSSFQGESTNKKIPGMVDIQVLPTGVVEYNLLMEIGENQYFLYTIKNETLYPISSNMEFNQAVMKRVQKPKKGDTNKIELGVTQTRDGLFKRVRP